MRIQLELNPELMERLVAEAQARGIGLEEYAGFLLREAIATHSEPQGSLSIEDLHAMLHETAEGSDKLPKRPTSAFTRESLYDELV
jgi:hypothetical protein